MNLTELAETNVKGFEVGKTPEDDGVQQELTNVKNPSQQVLISAVRVPCE